MTPIARVLVIAGALLAVLPGAAYAQGAVINRNVNVRAGPDRAFPMVAWLPAGAPVRVFGCTGGRSRWCDVANGRNRGWVNSGYLSNVRRGTPTVTFSVGPYWDMHYRGRPWYGSRSQWDAWGSPSFRPPPPWR